MARLIVHIGYPKSASTLLQKSVFPHLEDAEFLGAKTDPDLYRALGHRILDGGEDERAAILATYRQRIEQAKQPQIVSAEHFVMPSDCLAMGFPRPLPLLNAKDIFPLFSKLSDQIVVVVILRRQEDWLKSWYQERVKRYETRSFREMVRSPSFQGVMESLRYDRVANQLATLFGKENVRFVPFELLKKSHTKFLIALTQAMGVKTADLPLPITKQSMGYGTIVMRRTTNKFLAAVAGLSPVNTPLDDSLFQISKKIYAYGSILPGLIRENQESYQLDNAIAAAFASGNSRLAKAWGLDISDLGYCRD